MYSVHRTKTRVVVAVVPVVVVVIVVVLLLVLLRLLFSQLLLRGKERNVFTRIFIYFLYTSICLLTVCFSFLVVVVVVGVVVSYMMV